MAHIRGLPGSVFLVQTPVHWDCIYGTFIQDNFKSVIFNDTATIVFWHDGTKTVVKTSPNDKFDREKGILWAYFIKHANGSKTKLQKEIAKLVERDIFKNY